ncbi:MAG TPA: DUF1810 domain-containing protein [bacterium]|nr:DUF1810 domain-containing protein [bacterium]
MAQDESRDQDSHNLERFVSAQNGIFERVLTELRGGQKTTHWMWFIFPQYKGLGSSSTSRHYAIKSLSEATAYLEHPVLGGRLLECCQALLQLECKSAHEIFGYPDELKLRSCMTLFESISPSNSIFSEVLQKYFGGQKDQYTLTLISTDDH